MVAPDGPLRAIADALSAAGNGLGLTSFESQQSLLDGPEQGFCAVLLWANGDNRLAARSLEPLAERFASIPLIVGCEAVQRWQVRSLLSAGAAGIVLADDLRHALLPCLRAIQAGQICVPRDYSQQLVPPTLSSREKQILSLVVMGYMNSEIAAQLFLAESTVKSHLSSAFAKLGVRSRNEAAQLIVDPERGLGTGVLRVELGPRDSAQRTPSPAR